jgi:hypothetical protein
MGERLGLAGERRLGAGHAMGDEVVETIVLAVKQCFP